MLKFIRQNLFFLFIALTLVGAGILAYAQKIDTAQADHCGFPHFNCGNPCPLGVCPPPPPPPPPASEQCYLIMNASPDTIGPGEVSTIDLTTNLGVPVGGNFTHIGNPSSYTFTTNGASATITAGQLGSSTGVYVTASGWSVEGKDCGTAEVRVNVSLKGITTCKLFMDGPTSLIAGQASSFTITANEPIAPGSLKITYSGSGSATIVLQNSTGGSVEVIAGAVPGTLSITASAIAGASAGTCAPASAQILILPIPPPPEPPECPVAYVLLGSNALNIGQSTLVYAPSGWSGGYFTSLNTVVASVSQVSGNSATVYANASGTTNITGSNWTASNGASNCSLLPDYLTVSGNGPSVTIDASTPVLYGDVSQITWRAENVDSGTPCTASSSPSGKWSGTFGAVGSSQSQTLTADTTFTITCNHSSGGGTVQASKQVTVSLPTLTCTPASQTVGVGANAGVSGSGGIEPYSWSAPGGSPASGSGVSFATSYAAAGSVSITLTDDIGQTAQCNVTVSSSAQAVSINVTAVPASVNMNGITTVYWSSSNTSSCVEDSGPGFTTGGTTSGSDASTALTTSPTRFQITCAHISGGAPGTAYVDVTVLSSPAASGWISGQNCKTVAPNTTCDSTITWGTSNVSNSAQVRLSINGGAETLFDCATNTGSSPSNTSGKLITMDVGSTYDFSLFSAPDCVDGSTGGSSGDVILFWDGASDAPSGWSCISCSGGSYENVFLRASDIAGATGGSSSLHTHSLTYQSATNGASITIGESIFSGGFLSRSDHTHTWGNVISTSGNELPEYKNLKLIKKTNPSVIPSGAIALFDGTIPSGWSYYSGGNNKYLRTAGDTSTGGGSHNHTFSLTSGLSTTGMPDTGNNTLVQTTHTHSFTNVALNAETLSPRYVSVKLAKLNADSPFTPDMIALFDANVPPEWTTVSTSSSVYYERLLLGSDTFGIQAGSDTHNHGGSITRTSSVPAGSTTVVLRSPPSNNIGSALSHTHDVTFTVGSASSVPPYKDVILAKFVGYSALATLSLAAIQTSNTVNLTPSNKDILAVRGDTSPATDPGTDPYTTNDASISAVTPIGDGDTITFGINIVNTQNSSPETNPILVEDTMYNLVPLDDGTVSASVICNGACTMPDPVINLDSSRNVLRLSFTVTPTGAGLAYPDVWTITYTVKTKATPGSAASAYRFLNEASINGQPATDWLTTPAILFFKDIDVPEIQER